MTIGDTLRGMLGEFRANLTELAHQDEQRIAEIQTLRRQLAQRNATIDEQNALILQLRAELVDEQQRAAIAQAGLDKAALMIGEMCGPSVQMVHAVGHIRFSPDEARAILLEMRPEIMLGHVRALLSILDEIGGFMTPAHQELIRAARKAVARG